MANDDAVRLSLSGHRAGRQAGYITLTEILLTLLLIVLGAMYLLRVGETQAKDRSPVPCVSAPAARATRAYGLIELLLCMAVLGVLAAGAAPSLLRWQERAQLNAAVSDLRSSIMAARLQAMQRSQRIDIVPLAGHDWHRGWVVLIDANNNQQLDPDEPVLQRSRRALPRLEVSAALTDAKRAYLAFGVTGRPRTAASAAQPQFGAFSFRLGSERRKLVIGFLGKVRSCDPDRDGAAC